MCTVSTPTDWPLGPVLEQARKQRRLSRKEAARRAGVSDTLLQTLERGYEMRRGQTFAARPRPETVIAVAQALGVNPRDALKLANLDTSILDTPPQSEDDAAYQAFRSMYDTFERAWGHERARDAINRLARDAGTTPTRGHRDAG